MNMKPANRDGSAAIQSNRAKFRFYRVDGQVRAMCCQLTGRCQNVGRMNPARTGQRSRLVSLSNLLRSFPQNRASAQQPLADPISLQKACKSLSLTDDTPLAFEHSDTMT
jgi:hypothetical protein